MQVIEKVNGGKIFPKGVGLTLGKFDGIHIGHRELIERIKELCAGENLKSGMYTFKQHPANMLEGKPKVKLLSTPEKKKQLVEALRLDFMICDSFDSKIWSMSPEEFFEKILIEKYNAKIIVVGYNFRFGSQRTGDVEQLKKLGEAHGIKVEVVESVGFEGNCVSSTFIREVLNEGKVDLAQKLLDRYFSVEGEVLHGQAMGRKLGFRTANLVPDESILLPLDGEYITLAKIKDKIYKSITNVGVRPTFEGKARTVETYIFDFDEDIYGEFIEVFFIERIRGEKKYADVNELITQIKKDVDHTREYFEKFDDYSKII